jgi:hypothetical protein
MELVAVCNDDHVDAIFGHVNNGLLSIPRHQHGMNPARRKKAHVKLVLEQLSLY